MIKPFSVGIVKPKINLMKTLFPAVCLLFSINNYAQNPGDQVFEEDQVLIVELQFSQISFWDSLVANYESETYMLAAVTITDNAGTSEFDSIGIRLKGNSSYNHPGEKKSFKIDFNRYVDSMTYDGLKKLNFNNCFKDPTFMREKIYYEICEAAGINAPRANYANVYMNDTFWGFYELVEQVDDEFLKTHFDDQSENLFKAGDAFGMGGGGASADLNYYGTDQTDYDGSYTLENNTDENNWNDLIDLLDFINNSSDEEFSTQLADHFNVPQLISSFVLYNYFSNLDSYLNSARNYYVYNKDSSGIWEWINWDCNEAFGSYIGGLGGLDMTELDLYYYTFDRPLFERILTIDATKAIYETYYCSLTTDYLTTEFIGNLIDQLYELIQPHVYNDYNKMYSNADFEANLNEDITSMGPGGGTLYGLTSFVESRVAYLEDVLFCEQVGIENSIHSSIELYPNPAEDILHIYLNEITGETVVTILDIHGQLVLNQILFNGNFTSIDINSLPAGFYLLRIQNEDKYLASTFVKK